MIFEIEVVSDKYPVLVIIIFAALGWAFGRKINPGTIVIGLLYMVISLVCLLSVPHLLEAVRYFLRKNEIYFLSGITPGWVDFLAFVLTLGYFMWENWRENQIPPVKNTVKAIFAGIIGACLFFFFTTIFDPFSADFHDRQKEIQDMINEHKTQRSPNPNGDVWSIQAEAALMDTCLSQLKNGLPKTIDTTLLSPQFYCDCIVREIKKHNKPSQVSTLSPEDLRRYFSTCLESSKPEE